MPIGTFPQGLNDLPVTHWMQGRGALGIQYPPLWHVWFDDFDKFTAGDWVITTTEAGANSATEAIGDADGGVLVLTNDIADNDLDFLQSTAELFTVVVGKKLYFETRLKINEVIQVDAIFGLQVRDTTALAVSDGVFFQTDDGDALLDFHSMASSVDTAITGVHTLVADTFAKFAFYWDGVSSILVAVNDVVVGSLNNVVPPTTELTVSFGHQQGEATNAKILSIDYIFVAKER